MVDAPDLVVWDDRLLATFGLPLAVEVIKNTESSVALRPRLRRTLEQIGAKSILAVAGQGRRNYRWSNEQQLILAVSLELLEDGLRQLPLAEVLTVLLGDAKS